ncbi:MAG: squalene--hopene cyclase, partial [Gammaproteobacteria bacterium]|nr:squalene--hopene cyclase [Gammaproteobacteria bacterium]
MSKNLSIMHEFSRLNDAIQRAAEHIVSQQHKDGHWCYELEADCTIPAEYILMMHHMDEVDDALQARLASYLKSRQNEEGGWPLYHGGATDISCTVKSYYALKIAREDIHSPHMVKARNAVLSRGGAERSNVFTRIMLAMFEQIPWKGTPFIPVEIMLFPRWFFFHLDKVAYWSRTVMVPLFILCSLRVKARNPSRTNIQELFATPPDQIKDWFVPDSLVSRIFIYLDLFGKLIEPLIPRFIRHKAIKQAEKWFIERLNGEDGLGAIFPAMVNAYEAMDLLGYPENHPHRQIARKALQKLVVEKEGMAYCQPCVSPVWDTSLACHALMSADEKKYNASIKSSLDWLVNEQILDVKGDWAVNAPDIEPGGWAFQYGNDYYPDLDDTAVVAWAMDRADNRDQYAENINRAASWLDGNQSSDGGFAAFDLDNTHYLLNSIPFADHGALLDPPTADVSGRCLAFLGRLKKAGRGDDYRESLERCLAYLRKEQEPDGAWFG